MSITNLNNKEAEESVLVSAILVEENLFQLIEQSESIFYYEIHKTIFRQIQELYFEGHKIDFVILSASFPKDDEIHHTITMLAVNSKTTINFSGLLAILIELNKRRLIYAKCQDTLQCIPTGKKSADEYIQDIAELGESIQTADTDGSMDMSEFAEQEIDDIYSVDNYTRTGIPAIDDMIIGLFDGQMIVVAGPPGSGKTTLALNIVENINDALMASLEMMKADLFAKMLAREARVDSKKIESLKMSPEEKERVNRAKLKIQQECRMTVTDDISKLNPIKNYIRQQCKKRDYKVIIIDHVHLIDGVKGNNENERFTKISMNFKNLAKELKTPIILLVQLLKEATRGISAPTQADLRGSGSWAQDADTIIFTYFLGSEGDRTHNVAIGKCKKATVGKVQDIIFEPQFSSFRSSAPDWRNLQNPEHFHD